jgi:hypothetical protein
MQGDPCSWSKVCEALQLRELLNEYFKHKERARVPVRPETVLPCKVGFLSKMSLRRNDSTA